MKVYKNNSIDQTQRSDPTRGTLPGLHSSHLLVILFTILQCSKYLLSRNDIPTTPLFPAETIPPPPIVMQT